MVLPSKLYHEYMRQHGPWFVSVFWYNKPANGCTMASEWSWGLGSERKQRVPAGRRDDHSATGEGTLLIMGLVFRSIAGDHLSARELRTIVVLNGK